MEQVILNLPDKEYNRLNNYYMKHFGYEIYTQLYNFIGTEIEKCREYEDDKKVEMPHPTINKNLDEFLAIVRYPDNTYVSRKQETYKECLECLNEWSKHSFSKEKIRPNQTDIQTGYRKERGKWVLTCRVNGKQRYYGQYDTRSDALLVGEFLRKNNYDDHYSLKYLSEHFGGCNQQTLSKYYLKLAKGEIVL